MIKSLTLAGKAIRKRLRRAIVALAQPPADSHRDDWTEYYRFPPF
jgi:hypothetical protein